MSVYATLNPSDIGTGLTLSGGNLTVVHGASNFWTSVRSTIRKRAGKWYFEIKNDANGATTGDAMWGFMLITDALTTYPGNSGLTADSMGWEANLTPNSAKFQDGSLGAVGGYGTVAAGQYSYFAIDLDAGKLWVKNSAAAGWAGGGDPAAGTSPTFTFTPNINLHVAIGEFSPPQSSTVNFGATAFNGTVPSGFNSGWYTPNPPAAPVYNRSFNVASSAQIQGVATDGTYIYVSDATHLYKYTKAGSLVTSRSVTGDNPTDKDQINGLMYRGGVLYASAAKFVSSTGTSWIVEYDPSTLTYIDHHAITGDWFSEGIAYYSSYYWVCFHATKKIAKVDPATWAVAASYDVTFDITGSSGGFGSGQGYDGLAWQGDFLFCNIHETYNENYLDVYYWNGTSFEEVSRYTPFTSKSTQGLCVDANGEWWFAERNLAGGGAFDSVATSEALVVTVPGPVAVHHRKMQRAQ